MEIISTRTKNTQNLLKQGKARSSGKFASNTRIQDDEADLSAQATWQDFFVSTNKQTKIPHKIDIFGIYCIGVTEVFNWKSRY